MNERMMKAVLALTRRGFEVHHFATAEEAGRFILSDIAPGATVGIGGSMTIQDMGLAERLIETGHRVFWHWLPHEDRPALFAQAAQADVYLASANAITSDGQIVNIDGTGNRVAALTHGPRCVMLVVGQNKLVDGGIPAAIARIKQEACPPNARRLQKQTPCALTGRCNEALCGAERMCNVTGILAHPTGGRRTVVALVDQSLGY